MDRERCESWLRLSVTFDADDPAVFMAIGESISVTYCGALSPAECRGTDEDDGCAR